MGAGGFGHIPHGHLHVARSLIQRATSVPMTEQGYQEAMANKFWWRGFWVGILVASVVWFIFWELT